MIARKVNFAVNELITNKMGTMFEVTLKKFYIRHSITHRVKSDQSCRASLSRLCWMSYARKSLERS